MFAELPGAALDKGGFRVKEVLPVVHIHHRIAAFLALVVRAADRRSHCGRRADIGCESRDVTPAWMRGRSSTAGCGSALSPGFYRPAGLVVVVKSKSNTLTLSLEQAALLVRG